MSIGFWIEIKILKLNQRTSGHVNTHLISGHIISTKRTRPGCKLPSGFEYKFYFLHLNDFVPRSRGPSP